MQSYVTDSVLPYLFSNLLLGSCLCHTYQMIVLSQQATFLSTNHCAKTVQANNELQHLKSALLRTTADNGHALDPVGVASWS